MSASESAPGPAGLHLVSGVVLLGPEERAVAAMLDGRRNQQLAWRLAFSTAEGPGTGRPRVCCGFVLYDGLTTKLRRPREQRS